MLFCKAILFTFCFQDPTSALLQLAENSGMSSRFHALSLGQGQAPIATRMIKEGVKDVSSSHLIYSETLSLLEGIILYCSNVYYAL